MKKRLYKILLSLLVIIGTFLQVFDTKAIADGTKRNVSATITELRLENPIGTKATELNKNSSFYVAMDWKVDNPNEILNEGDYFDIDLPDSLRFPPGYAQEDFPLTDSNSNRIASAHLTRGPENVGGKIRVTFNNNIKNKYNVRGTLYLGALFNKTVTVDNQQNTFSVVVNGKQASTTVKVTKITKPADQVLTKWGARTTENGQTKNEVSWTADVNYRQANLKNAVITDSLTGQGEYIPSSFKLQKVVFNDEGTATSYGDIVDLTTKLTFDNGNKSFKIDLGDGGTSQYRLTYKTTYVAGTELKNKISISYVGETKEVSFKFKDQKAGGTAGGDLASKIKLIKVDEEDENVVLQDAVFEVTGPNNQKFELRTGADGTIVSNVLRQGTYKVREITPPQGYVLGEEEYTLEVTPAGGAIKKITNKKIKINISGTKTWNDNNDQDGKRPTSIKVKLYKKVGNNNPEYVTEKVVTEGADKAWKWKFENLDKYENKQEIQYTVEEEVTNGYAGVVTGSMAAGFKITNSYTPETVNISGEKTWKDNNDQDGKRPQSITVKLMKKVEGGQPEVKETKVVREGTDKKWKYEFNNLPRYENGKLITYSIDEVDVPGYTKETTATRTTNGPDYNLTNKHEPETVNISGEKTWDDNNNQDGKRPESITVKLMKKVEGGQLEVKETKVVREGTDKKWKYEFNNLPRYENGKLITYSVDEVDVPGYTKETTATRTTNGPDYNLTNKHEPEKRAIEGQKIWNDNNNQDGKRPTSIKVKLYKKVGNNNPEYVTEKVVTEGADKAWKWKFENLDKYENKQEIEYTVEEEAVGEGYVGIVTGSMAAGFKITNSRTPEKTFVEGEKTWDDADNQDGKRPTTITVKLYKKVGDKEKEEVTTQEVKADDQGKWKYKFDNLPKYEGGKLIEYSVEEKAVDGYTTTINGTNITNTHTPEKTFVEGEKTWDDADNQDGKRPDKIKVILNKTVDGKTSKVAEKEVTKDNWNYEFTNLPKYEGGKEITYSIDEEAVPGYEKSIDGYNLKNSYTPEVVNVQGTKTWNDANNQDGKRPGSIKVILNKTVDGKTTKVAEKEVTAKDNWNYAFNDLPKYENGKEIKYSIDEVDVPGYEKSIKGYNLENKYIPKKPGLPKTGSAPSEVGGLGVLGLLAGYMLIRRKNKAN